MTNRRTLKFSILAAAVMALCLPMLAAAQGSYDPYGRNRDDDYYRRNGRFDERYLRDSIHRLDRLAKDFEREVDRNLDRSRRDGTRREDQINAEARQFRNAVGDLKSRFGNGRDLNRSQNEAQRVFQEARQLERIGFGRGNNGRLGSLWSQIQQELNVISNAFGNYGSNNGGYYPNDRRNRTNNNNDWWRRIPWPNR
ncbi:MAG: hypothetical protein AABN95_14280 [Acidobacteriota bacterium]